MCLVCVDWIKGKLTKEEALNNMAEIIISSPLVSEKEAEHYLETVKLIEGEDDSDTQ